jgi:hypothetical protein
MADLPRVLVPIIPLGEVDGVSLLLLTVELWPTEIVLTAAGVRTDETDRRDDEYEQSMTAWFKEGRIGESPEMPGSLLLRGIKLEIRDDADRPYDVVTAEFAGTGTEWRGIWVARPGLAKTARRVRVASAPDSTLRWAAIELDPS